MAPTESEMQCSINIPPSAVSSLFPNQTLLCFFIALFPINYFLLLLSFCFYTQGEIARIPAAGQSERCPFTFSVGSLRSAIHLDLIS